MSAPRTALEAQREQYEAWAGVRMKLQLARFPKSPNEFVASDAQLAWIAWQAAQAAVVAPAPAEPVAWIGMTAHRMLNGEFPKLRVSRTQMEHFRTPLYTKTPTPAPVAQWISVADRLPQLWGSVLAFPRPPGTPLAYVNSRKTWKYVSAGLVRAWPVTHWMPLPPPPASADAGEAP